MAEQQNVFNKLRQLFRSQIVLRQTDTGRIKVKDINFAQTSLTSNFIDRYNRLHNTQGSTWATKYAAKHNARNAYEVQRQELFRDYEIMDSDPIIASSLDIYSDESTVDNVQKQILNIKTDNVKIAKILHNLFYDIMNIEFNLWSWIRNLTKYGDFYLQLDILDKYGIVNIKPISPYDVIRLEEHDPENPSLIQFELTVDGTNSIHGGNIPTELKENYEVAHFRLMSDANYLPYGKSMLEGARKVWKQLTLMEDAMLIHRIMRAPEKRVFKLDIGNIPPNEVDNFMQQVINKMKKIPVIDQKTGEYNLRYNVESVTEDYFLPVRGGDSGTSIDTLQGLDNNGQIEDIEYLRNKMMAALKIPKAFLGYEEGVGSKATLAAEDVRFARTIERLQKIICAELEKIAIVHLYTQGFDDAELLDFELELTNPSMIHEQEKLELLTQKQEIAAALIENRLMSREWIYENIFEFNENEKKELFDQIVEDQKQAFRFEQIVTEGNDPAVTGEKDMESGGTSGMAAGGGGYTGGMFGESDWGGSEKGRFKKDVNPHGAKSKDQKDATAYHRERQGKREFKGKSPLATSKGSTLVAREGLLNSLKMKFGRNLTDKSMLSEDIILNDDDR